MNSDLREMPNAVGPEKSVLSTILQEPKDFIPAAIEEGLMSRHFYTPARSELFDFIMKMHESNEPVELISLVSKLHSGGILDRLGGPSAISDIYSYSPSSLSFRNHAKILREKLILRDIITMGRNAAESAFDAPDDAAEVLSEAEKQITAIVSTSTVGGKTKTLKSILSECIDGYEQRTKNESAEMGVPTGTLLDQHLRGLHAGRVYILCAYPKGGKSVLASQIAVHVACNESASVLFVTMEMSEKEIADRMIIQSGRMPAEAFSSPRSYAVRTGANGPTAETTKAVMNSIRKLSESRMAIVRPPNRNIRTIVSIIRKAHRETGIKVAIVDYAQLIQCSGLIGQEELKHVSHELQGLAQELEIAIVLPSQLNADGDTKNGRVLEEDAAAVINIVQDRNKESETYGQHRHILIVADRFNGSGGQRVPLILDKRTIQFVEGDDETTSKPKEKFKK